MLKGFRNLLFKNLSLLLQKLECWNTFELGYVGCDIQAKPLWPKSKLFENYCLPLCEYSYSETEV